MAEAARLSDDVATRTWVLALRQTAGRARRGRTWIDPVGNFAATLSIRPAPAPAQAALRSFVAAIALWEALDALTGQGQRIALKWPNDLLIDDGKLAGILLEADGARLRIGIGVNLTQVPDPAGVEPGALRPVSVLAETGIHIQPETLLDHLGPAFEAWEERLLVHGFAPVRAAFLARAARLGDQITARTAGRSLTGRFETIDETGALILATPQGRVPVLVADIFF